MGLTHLDAGVIIGFLDGDDSHHDTARAALSSSLKQGDQLFIAASALAECLVGPARRSAKAVELVRTAVHRLPVSVVDLDEEIATQAAILRARHRTLKLPDALVIATAATSGADQLITTDRKWPSAKAMKLDLVVEQI
jgi:predicted nucleic acid-binding protein